MLLPSSILHVCHAYEVSGNSASCSHCLLYAVWENTAYRISLCVPGFISYAEKKSVTWHACTWLEPEPLEPPQLDHAPGTYTHSSWLWACADH